MILLNTLKFVVRSTYKHPAWLVKPSYWNHVYKVEARKAGK